MTHARTRAASFAQLLVVLAAGFWLGVIVHFGLAAATTFYTVRSLHPSLTDPDRPADAKDFSGTAFDVGQPDFIAGTVINGVLNRGVMPISTACLAVVVVGLLLSQIARRRIAWVSDALALVILACLVASFINLEAIMVPYAEMYDGSVAPAARAEARAVFDGMHKWSERLFGVIALCLVGLLAAAALAPHPTVSDPAATNAQANDG
ncbi:MAG: hypothetical protein AAGK09_06250 [Planctomycetota bacterium]